MRRENSEPASIIRRSLLFAAGLAAVLALAALGCRAPARPPEFDGRHFSGRGDVEYLKLLDFSRRLFTPDPEFQNLAMLYQPAWNGLVEGPTWDAWWIQNSYGTTYCALPFLEEPFVTFLQNAQDLWFDQMGDGKRRGRPNDEVAPDGCLCDCAGPGWVIYKQGDGRTKIHDWGIEFTAAGIVMQAELLLDRPRRGGHRALPADARAVRELHRVAPRPDEQPLPGRRGGEPARPELRRLASSPTGPMTRPTWRDSRSPHRRARPPDRAREAGRPRRQSGGIHPPPRARPERPAAPSDGRGLLHQVPGPGRHEARRLRRRPHGYFEASPNHDAIAFRVVPDDQAERIYAKMSAIPGLRPYDLILPNYSRPRRHVREARRAVEVRPLGQRRPLVDLRGADGPGLLPAGRSTTTPAGRSSG